MLSTYKFRFLLSIFISLLLAQKAIAADIIFVTQVPQPEDFNTILSTFGNHIASAKQAPRGGGLMIRYNDGSIRDLTAAAGFGQTGLQTNNAIAVRDPSVHWDANKVIFSMVVGAPARQYDNSEFYWQLYEITGLRKNENPQITKVVNQPQGFNNIMPIYGTQDQIFFVSDRPRNGARHLYPQLDEYESSPSNTGIWRLNPNNGNLTLLDHAPSGAYNPIIDSFGRLVYSRWDHLQRDQQAGSTTGPGAFNFSNESAQAARLGNHNETFPEAREEIERSSPFVNLFTINQFFPWTLNQDGSEHETLNHIGRHELRSYFDRSFNNDSALKEFIAGNSNRNNPRSIDNFMQIKEDPRTPGAYFGIDAPEFKTHASGQIVKLYAPLGLPADQISLDYITSRETSNVSNSPTASHTGFYRDVLPLSDGSIISAHTTETREDLNIGSATNFKSRYDFRLKNIRQSGDSFRAFNQLTSGISKDVSFWDPDKLVTVSGALWEVQPVELIARPRPNETTASIKPPEQQIFTEEGVDPRQFADYLRQQNLALIISRNVTTRDVADKQQPFNLRVAGSTTLTTSETGKLYDVANLQIFQGDQIRGYASPARGRRILAVPLHDAPSGTVRVFPDGSTAALVPAARALSWQLADSNSSAVVRERYWLSFQAGEIRVCASCHGLNSKDQQGRSEPQNPPEALRDILRTWKSGAGVGAAIPIVPNPTAIPPKATASPNTPTQNANPPPKAQSNFSLSIKSVSTNGTVSNGWILSKAITTLSITGPEIASNSDASIILNVDGINCAKKLNLKSGKTILRTRMPKILGEYKAQLSLQVKSTQVASVAALTKTTQALRKRTKINVKKERCNLCTALGRFK